MSVNPANNDNNMYQGSTFAVVRLVLPQASSLSKQCLKLVDGTSTWKSMVRVSVAAKQFVHGKHSPTTP